MVEADLDHEVAIWARTLVEHGRCAAAQSLAAYRKKPRSAKRLHRARKALARLRGALMDVGAAAGVPAELGDRVNDLHRRAGKVRDTDVLIHRVRDYMKTSSAAERAELELVCAALRHRRARARRKLSRTLRSAGNLQP